MAHVPRHPARGTQALAVSALLVELWAAGNQGSGRSSLRSPFLAHHHLQDPWPQESSLHTPTPTPDPLPQGPVSPGKGSFPRSSGA